MVSSKAWFSFSENEKFQGNEPNFFDISDKPWKKLLEDNAVVILKELESIVVNQNKNIIPYFNQTLASAPKAWNIFPLRFWGKTYTENCLQAKETYRVINQINGVTSCGFSILKPHTNIKPHYGDSNVMYRCHLTLKSKGSVDEIGIRVGEEKRTWENGKVFAFCDAHNHEVWNNTDEERWVMIIDILREEFIDQREKICNMVSASTWWQVTFQNTSILPHLPRFFRRLLLRITPYFLSKKSK